MVDVFYDVIGSALKSVEKCSLKYKFITEMLTLFLLDNCA